MTKSSQGFRLAEEESIPSEGVSKAAKAAMDTLRQFRQSLEDGARRVRKIISVRMPDGTVQEQEFDVKVYPPAGSREIDWARGHSELDEDGYEPESSSSEPSPESSGHI